MSLQLSNSVMKKSKKSYCAKYRYIKKIILEDAVTLASFSSPNFDETNYTDNSKTIDFAVNDEIKNLNNAISCDYQYDNIVQPENYLEYIMDEYDNYEENYYEFECDSKDSDNEEIQETAGGEECNNADIINRQNNVINNPKKASDNFLSFLKQFAVQFRVPHIQINSLLKGYIL